MTRKHFIAWICLAIATVAMAEVHHGVWFWGSTTLPDGSSSPYGSTDVVGDAVKENDLIAFFDLYKVKRVYGSYQNRPVTEAPVIAAWNAKLDGAGVMSQLLIDGDAVNDTNHVDNILNKVTNRLITFNANLGTNDYAKFDGLHLDLEPQKLALWDSGTPEVKRGLLDDLFDAYVDIRDLLDSSGATNIPMYADIPFFWDKLPADGGSIGWTNAADRDGWYGSLSGPLEGLSIMTFSKDSAPEVEDATAYERTNEFFTGFSRIAIQGKVGTNEVWTNFFAFADALMALDDAHGPDESTDIENLGFWRYSLETFGPTLTTAPVISGVSAVASNLWISFPAIPGHLYTVKSSTNFVDWQDEIGGRLRTVSTQYFEMLSFPIPMVHPFSATRVDIQQDP